MSCKYCKHESIAYKHVKDEENRDLYIRVAEPMPYDDCDIRDAEPMISWPDADIIDWADHMPRLCVGAYDTDGGEECISIPIRFCPMCGRKLPTGLEVTDG